MLDRIAISLIEIYQKQLSIMLPYSCRFSPSCSEYARQAVMKYGFFKGSLKAARRLLCCHPFSRKASYNPLI